MASAFLIAAKPVILSGNFMFELATHTRFRSTFALIVSWVLVLHAAAQTRIHSDAVPAAFSDTWRDASRLSGEPQKAALARLATIREWEPYFRSALNSLDDQKLRDLLRPALIQCQSELFLWNMERAKEWARDRRIDFLTSLAAMTDNEVNATILGEYVISVSHELAADHSTRSRIPRSFDPDFTTRSFLMSRTTTLATLANMNRGYQQLSGDNVALNGKTNIRHRFVHGRTGWVEPRVVEQSLVMTNEQLSERIHLAGVSWVHSVISVNGDCEFRDLVDSLLICDGDLKFIHDAPRSTGQCTGCMIICNGNIDIPNGFELASGVVIYAAGDCTAGHKVGKSSCTILTGGKNGAIPSETATQVERDFYAKHILENVRENPFRVKFVAPAEVGMELDLKGVTLVRIGALRDSSPLARAGLEAGDRVVQLNGMPIKSAAQFRRQLRESLLWGTGLFEVQRGEEKFLRLVRFAEPAKR